MSRHLITIALIVIVIVVNKMTADSMKSCGTGQWLCSGEQNQTCISLNKFCDGVRHCIDGADEPVGCTNCNRTYTGRSGIRYPLRVTGPIQRYLPFVCQLDFAAAGEEFGDFIELTFLSFQIGRLEVTRKQTASCERGFMKIVENSSDPDVPIPHFGNFCGILSESSATYYSRTSKVSVLVAVPGRASNPSTSTFSLFLTFRFLGKSQREGLMEDIGRPVPGTFCDRVLEDCFRRRCKIRSPNFPGFYQRNVTCNFFVKQMQVPQSKVAHIVLSQRDDYKISIPKGRESLSTKSPKNSRNSLLSTDCLPGLSDSLKVYDGSSTASPLLAQFCGGGTLPKIVSSSNQLLVQLYSSSSQPLTSSKVEVEVNVVFQPDLSTQMQQYGSNCSFTIDANRHPKRGILRSPRHTMPKNSTCTYMFRGSSTYHRIWLYFVSYLASPEKTGSENCAYSKLELIDGDSRWSQMQLDMHPSHLTFCGDKITPKVCAHAAEFPPLYIPERPCKFPEESYVSSSYDYTITQSFLQSSDTSDMLSASSFVARYEFVETKQNVDVSDHSMCNQRFHSRYAIAGLFSSPKNLFFYGRGGNFNLNCIYSFKGELSERVRITILRLHIPLHRSESKCGTQYDSERQRFVCLKSNGESEKSARIEISESRDGYSFPIGCICNETSQAKQSRFVIDSVVNDVHFVFSITQMTAYEDFNDFSFDAKFEFYNTTSCDSQFTDGVPGLVREGTIEYHVPRMISSRTKMRWALRCRFQIKAMSQKYLYIQFRGLDITPDMCYNGLWVLVYQDSNSKPTTSACMTSRISKLSREKEYHVFSNSWYNDTLSFSGDDHKDSLFIELMGSSHIQGSVVVFHWLEVTKPFYRSLSGRPLRNIDCMFECPEIGACIHPHLWCDGTDHCPSGFDELPENCRTFSNGLTYLSLVVCFATVVLVVVMVLVLWVIFKHRSQFSSESRKRTKGIHRLTPTQDYQLESPLS